MLRIALLVTLLFASLIPTVIYAQDDATKPPIPWILSQQNDNGGWSDGFTEGSGAGITVDVLIALWAAGVDLTHLDPSPLDYLKNYANLNANLLSPGLAAKLTLAAVLYDQDPTSFSSLNLLDIMTQHPSEVGQYSQTIFEHCLILVALHAAQEPIPSSAVQFIEDNAQDDGGWGFASDSPSDTNTTAVCLQALIGVGYTGGAVDNGLAYLRSLQNPDGGWMFTKPSEFTSESDAASTAMVIMTLTAAREDLNTWNNPQTALLDFQTENGAFDFGAGVSPDYRLWATTQAIPALAGVTWLDIK